MKWPLVQITECARIVGGSTPDTNTPSYWGGGIPWATPKDLSELEGAMIGSTPRTITEAGLASCSSELLPVDSVLFSSRAPIGHVAINTVPMATNQGFKSFVPIANKLDSRFLYHWLKANKAYLQSLGNGATFKEVSKEIVSRISIPLPPVEEQRRIAAILDHAETLRAKRRQALAKLDTLTQALFLEMFGDLTKTHSFETLPLSKVCDVRDGTHTSPLFYASGYPLVTSKNLRDGVVNVDGAKYISESDYFEINKRSKVHWGDILMPMIGTVGNPVLIVDEPNYAVKNVAIIKFGENSPSRRFILTLLNGPYFDYVTRQKKRGGTQGFLALGDTRSLPIPLPSRKHQERFEQRAIAIAEERFKAMKSSAKFEVLVKSLQHRAFRGEL